MGRWNHLRPKNGKIYDCEMWLEEGNMDELKVRGTSSSCSARRPGFARNKPDQGHQENRCLSPSRNSGKYPKA